MRASLDQIAVWKDWAARITAPLTMVTVGDILTALTQERELFNALVKEHEKLFTEYAGYRQAATRRVRELEEAVESRQRYAHSVELRNAWPYTTPSGHGYRHPQTVDAIKAMLQTQMQGDLENWVTAEMPPGPTWNMVSDVLEALRQAELRCPDGD